MFTKLRFLTIISLFVIGISLTACETMGGAGRDIQSAGESIEGAAD